LSGFLILAGAAQAELRIANFRQIPGILSSMTGVSSQEDDIRNYFTENSSKLPETGELTEAKVSFLMTEISFASLYCEKFIQLEKARVPQDRWAFKTVDFSEPLSQFKDPVNAQNLFTGMSIQFWGRNPTADEMAILTDEFSGWLADPSEVSTLSALEPTLLNLCSIFLSTPAVWTEAP
jgi:hypothetical protein